MDEDKTWPEYESTSFGKDFEPLSDPDCKALFNTQIPPGIGIVDTNKRKGKDVAGVKIFALRGTTMTKQEIEEYMDNEKITSMVLLACRKA